MSNTREAGRIRDIFHGRVFRHSAINLLSPPSFILLVSFSRA